MSLHALKALNNEHLFYKKNNLNNYEFSELKVLKVYTNSIH